VLFPERTVKAVNSRSLPFLWETTYPLSMSLFRPIKMQVASENNFFLLFTTLCLLYFENMPLTQTDIDDELRDPDFPDIGADEFIPGFNYPPVITSDPDTMAYVDSLYQYQVTATDQNGDTLTYSLSVAPFWLTITDSTGLIEGIPAQNNLGDTTVTVVVDDVLFHRNLDKIGEENVAVPLSW